MKLKNAIPLMFFMIFVAQNCFGINASDVAVIDLYVAFTLHPKMSLFDFNRIGFYKLELGLKEDEFKQKAAKLKDSAPNRDKELINLEDEIYELGCKKSDLIEAAFGKPEREINEMPALKELESSIRKKERELIAIRHQIENYDLTSPEETRQIAAQIEKEVFEAINEVAKEKNFSVVLNSSNPCAVTYSKNYTNSEIYGQGIPGINFMLFYSFLAKNNLETPWDEVPPSRDLVNWMELTKYPAAMNILPMRPYPLVLSGGQSILAEVLKKIYNRYNIEPSVYGVVESVLEKLEQSQYGKEVEEKFRKYDF